MNQKQKVVLLYTVVIIGLMVIFPPYVVENFRQVVIKSGYGFILDLPLYLPTSSSVVIPATVNVSALFIQLLGTLIVGGLSYIALKED